MVENTAHKVILVTNTININGVDVLTTAFLHSVRALASFKNFFRAVRVLKLPFNEVDQCFF